MHLQNSYTVIFHRKCDRKMADPMTHFAINLGQNMYILETTFPQKITPYERQFGWQLNNICFGVYIGRKNFGG